MALGDRVAARSKQGGNVAGGVDKASSVARGGKGGVSSVQLATIGMGVWIMVVEQVCEVRVAGKGVQGFKGVQLLARRTTLMLNVI